MAMILYAQPKVTRTQRLLAIAQHNEIDLQVVPNAGTDGSEIPVLDTGKGCIFSTNAVGRYLSRIRPDLGLYGQNFTESGEVDSWIEYITLELEVFLLAWTGPYPQNPEANERAKNDASVSLELLNKHLLHWTFLVGESLTWADIQLASVLFDPLEKHKVLQPLMENLGNLKRWYCLVVQQEFFKKQFGASTAVKQFFGQGGGAVPSADGGNKQQQQQSKKEKKLQNQQQGQKKGETKEQQNSKQNKNEKKKGGESQGGKKPDGGAADSKPEPTPEEKAASLLKAVKKEGGKRGIEISGASDMGGLQFFCTTIAKPNGNMDLMEASMAAMNVECAPDAEERTGCSSAVGKLIVCNAEDNSCLDIVTYVPEAIYKEGKTDAEEFMKQTLINVKECSEHDELQYIVKRPNSGKKLAFASLKCGIDMKPQSRYAEKMKDVVIQQGIRYLKSKGLFPEHDDSDDEECLYGDDIEW